MSYRYSQYFFEMYILVRARDKTKKQFYFGL
ncbi:hypothetical protein I580_01577 [Enterococcus caccae ATCC BAA-1240]|uniref:Uncharacterized protein n=1 Tax=Enterococcus caccae ATCC BAA-1240 TaxID=1158612 RepID=R3TZJ8_9ENTE|nr:hypothetical protein UC7_01275 [Enterococcus caccae ATCC BAA-1240]EOT60677.1 hypothetical protein I580_01577 [Enterococcus caccae ATCC BAA-1240]